MNIQLIQGEFSTKEALELITQMIHVKIKYHENKIANNSNEEDTKYRESKIKRLQKELSDSKELMQLLSKSTVKDLSPAEKKKVQNQLIDIFKTIPSLAIFLLPGGAVLLPIFIKLIPKLLPSAFDDNRVEKSSEKR